jgi:hypothetical protein
LDTCAPAGYHPELDDAPFLNDDSVTFYQSYIGILQWALELGRIDIAYFASAMAKFAAIPREGHMTLVVCGFVYTKKPHKSRNFIDPLAKDWSARNWISKDWTKFFPDLHTEVIPPDAPELLGEAVQVNMFCDASTDHPNDIDRNAYHLRGLF